MTDKSAFVRLREDEREVRKALIMEAAMNLFSKKAFHKIGMRDIAKAAGVSAASIYRYFPSRDDLFVEALIQDMNNIEQLIEEAIEQGRDSIEDLAIAVVDYLIDNEATFQMMCHFMIRGGMDSRVESKFNAVSIYFLNMFNELVKRTSGQTDQIFTNAFFASITGVVMTFLHYPGLSKEQKRKYMHELALLIMRTGGPTTDFMKTHE